MGYAQSKFRNLEEAAEILLNASPHDGIGVKEIAQRLDCNRATAYRYLDEIKEEYPLIEVKRGRYRLDPAHYLSNVRLRPDEALSIYLALRRFIRQTTDAPEFMISALKKVAPALRHPHLTDALIQSSNHLQAERPATEEYIGVWEILQQGWQENIVVRIYHQKARQNDVEMHEIEPYLFEPAVLSHGVYVIAWSRTRKGLRTFKIDRIHRASLTTERFEPPQDLNVDDLLKNAWGVWYGQELHKVELLFVPEVARRVKETIWHPSQYIEDRPDGSVYWSVEIAGLREVLSWVRGWGHEVVVLGPPEFRQQVADDMRAAAKLYEE